MLVEDIMSEDVIFVVFFFDLYMLFKCEEEEEIDVDVVFVNFFLLKGDDDESD